MSFLSSRTQKEREDNPKVILPLPIIVPYPESVREFDQRLRGDPIGFRLEIHHHTVA
jgi:hypothetical protein